uniref:Uncharacterized protein n=1 Tax=Arundo donax TaxID=35708 RepID=A0A0A9APK3_ARUDO
MAPAFIMCTFRSCQGHQHMNIIKVSSFCSSLRVVNLWFLLCGCS